MKLFRKIKQRLVELNTAGSKLFLVGKFDDVSELEYLHTCQTNAKVVDLHKLSAINSVNATRIALSQLTRKAGKKNNIFGP